MEAEVRRLADDLYRRVDWAWAATRDGAVTMGWSPDTGPAADAWRGYNEGMIIYILGLGSPTFPLPDGAWQQWTAGYPKAWGTEYGETYLTFPPLFGHQFSHVWIDFRGIRDAFMRERNLDYFENSRRATYAQQAYAIANPMHWKGYGPDLFGVSASDGPADVVRDWYGEKRAFHGYAARGLGGAVAYDDGTLSPAALVSSLPFAPEIVLPAMREMLRRYGAAVYSTYGFVDAFNPSFDFDLKTRSGQQVPQVGWVDSDYLGIDSGATIAMLENYRSELVWRVMRKSPYVQRGLARAGFTGGWLDGKQ